MSYTVNDKQKSRTSIFCQLRDLLVFLEVPGLSQDFIPREGKALAYMCFSASAIDSSIIRIAQSACSSSMMSGGDMRIEFSPEPSVSNPR